MSRKYGIIQIKHIYTLSGTKILSEAWQDNLILCIYDESGAPVGFQYRNSSYAYDQFDTYWYRKNLQGDIVAIYDAYGTQLVSYRYDAWGNFVVSYQNNGVLTNAIHNPFTYRGYYYDSETGFYYLNSRYYDPATCRFINADGFISTGQGILGNNMYAYCGNNPTNKIDSTGTFWKEIGTFFSNAWNGISAWAKNTFGAGSSTTVTIFENETIATPNYFPIVIKSGTITTQIVSKHGDSSKPISVYANKDAQNPVWSSSAGIYINIYDFTLDLSAGLDNIGIYGSLTNGNTTESFGLRLNLSEFKVGFERSTTIQWDDKTETVYTNCSISGWAIIAAYVFITTGQFVKSPLCA